MDTQDREDWHPTEENMTESDHQGLLTTARAWENYEDELAAAIAASTDPEPHSKRRKQENFTGTPNNTDSTHPNVTQQHPATLSLGGHTLSTEGVSRRNRRRLLDGFWIAPNQPPSDPQHNHYHTYLRRNPPS